MQLMFNGNTFAQAVGLSGGHLTVIRSGSSSLNQGCSSISSEQKPRMYCCGRGRVREQQPNDVRSVVALFMIAISASKSVLWNLRKLRLLISQQKTTLVFVAIHIAKVCHE